MTTSEPAVSCTGLCVDYEGRRVLQDVTLDVAPDEVLGVLGPSGSGKTTLLSALAGFLAPAAGTIAMGGRVVATPGRADPPERRRVGMVFQHYALWPHLSALETVAYPFRRAGVRRREAEREAMALLERLRVAHLAGLRPAVLSGGEQQRVGLARALAGQPRLYLFDEPTAHLDAPLRALMRDEIAARRRETGAAAIYATHDAAEVLTVADRVVLLDAGRIRQIGTPVEIYERPVDLWAAALTGSAAVLPARLESISPTGVELLIGGVPVSVDGGGVGDVESTPRSAVRALIRPDWASFVGPLSGTISAVGYEGPHTDYQVETPAGPLVVREPGAPRREAGQRVTWKPERVWLLRAGPGESAGDERAISPARPVVRDASPGDW